MSFDVFGDEICYERLPVARFLPNVIPTQRDQAESLLETAGLYTMTEAEHGKVLDEIQAEHDDEIGALKNKIEAFETETEMLEEALADKDRQLEDADKDIARLEARIRELEQKAQRAASFWLTFDRE
jgi:chromosome segregation ATPase